MASAEIASAPAQSAIRSRGVLLSITPRASPSLTALKVDFAGSDRVENLDQMLCRKATATEMQEMQEMRRGIASGSQSPGLQQSGRQADAGASATRVRLAKSPGIPWCRCR
jgi:hypothetical protein